MAFGTVSIQEPIANWIDTTTEVAKASELAVSLLATCDFACVWWLAVSLQKSEGRPAPLIRRAPVACAAIMAVLSVTFFALTPVADRFGIQANGWWIPYAVSWLTFGTITAAGAGIVFWRQSTAVSSPILRASLIAIALGTSAEIPYQAFRGIEYFDSPTPALRLICFWLSDSRFILVALGCSLAALEPLMRSAISWYCRQLLYRPWALLRQATPELMITPDRSRIEDMLNLRNSWEQLHQRVVDIRDSTTYLFASWASPELLDQASGHAVKDGRADRGRTVATACWLEVTRRRALARSPKLHREIEGLPLVDVHVDDALTLREVRQLHRLYRSLKSHTVREFADSMQSTSEMPN
ncbi:MULTISPECIES: DUF6545 domain-containing protein [unclassified Streptomyces]|uniref:DUF6545 domain-containing protein n=1 Tax=unclassified Streptomyces TaxID=2593676 RepID=UPI002E2263EF|nr:hypothetical protein OG217_37905 [Streptomyces sp. NBC_01023]